MKSTSTHPSMFLIVFWLALAPCRGSASASEASSENPQAPLFYESITYGIVDGIELQLNIAMPTDSVKAEEQYPLLIFIHGGGWQTGHRNAYNGRIRKSADRGYVAATISHRLTAEKDNNGRPLYPWPAAIHDCKAAVRFLKTHAVRYHIDSRRIGVTGASSGGHLALMLGLADETAGLEGVVAMPEQENPALETVTDTTVHAVFNKSGPTEMVSCYTAPVVTPFLEDLLGKPSADFASYHEASPLVYLSKDDPPVMTIHGELDHVVPIAQARMLDERMKAAGLSHQYIELKGQKHVFSRDGGDKYWKAFYQFFDANFKNR